MPSIGNSPETKLLPKAFQFQDWPAYGILRHHCQTQARDGHTLLDGCEGPLQPPRPPMVCVSLQCLAVICMSGLYAYMQPGLEVCFWTADAPPVLMAKCPRGSLKVTDVNKLFRSAVESQQCTPEAL